jgi:hypothetical protein
LDDTTHNFFGVVWYLKNGVPLCGTRQNSDVALDLFTRQALITLARCTSVDNREGERWPDRPQWHPTLLANIATVQEKIAKT